MRFAIDPAAWKLDGLTNEQASMHIDEVLDVIAAALDKTGDVYYCEELFSQKVYKDLSLYETYDHEDISIDQDVRIRVAANITRCKAAEDFVDCAISRDEIKIKDRVVDFSTNLAWATARINTSLYQSIACLSHCRTGNVQCVSVEQSNNEGSIYFICADEHFTLYYQWLAACKSECDDDLDYIKGYAFPELDFVPNSFVGIKKMKTKLREACPLVVEHLAALNNYGKKIFKESWAEVPSKFGGIGVDISDENGKTKKNNKARIARTRLVDGENLVFWWHTKLLRHTDRIHIYPDRVQSGGKIIVGIFCVHLPL